MPVHYLFNSSGNWIAFRICTNVFDAHAKWVGWMPWGDADVVTTDGKYLGTIVEENRLFHFSGKPYRGYPGNPGHPGYPGYPGYPGFAGFSPLWRGTKDVNIQN